MTIPVPLTVSIAGKHITQQTGSLAFRREAVGGVQSITLGLNAPLKTELTVAIDQQQAHMLLTAIRGILGDLQLTPDQQTLSGEVVSRHLRAIEGGTADTPGEATA